MKKLIIAFLSLVILFSGQGVFASSSWNGASGDCQTISVANHTTNPVLSGGCWPRLSSVYANPGDDINVQIYYHNTGNTTANNTRIVLNAPTGSSTTQQISGQIISDQGSFPFGPVTVNLTNAQTLTFNSARWYPNQQGGSNYTSVGSNLIGNGLNIGSIAPGWSTAGSINVSFTVGSNSYIPQPQICQDVSASNYGYSLPCTYPTYPQLCQDPNATNYRGSLPCSYYTPPVSNCSIYNFTANTNNVTSGSPVTLSWNTSNCYTVNISGIGNVSTSGSQVVYPSYSTNYVLTAYGSNGTTQSQSVYISVNNYIIPVSSCSIYNFTANTTSVTSGSPVTLSWNTNNCSYVNIQGIGNVSNSSSQVVYPSYSTNYILTAYGYNGLTQSQSVYVSVNNNVVVYNTNVVTTVATNVSRDSAQLNGLITNQNYYNTSTYFEYGTTVDLGLRTASNSTNNTSAFNQYVTNLTPDTIYYFRAVSQNSNGSTTRGSIEIFQTLGAEKVAPVIIQGTTVIGTQSPIMLKIENRYESIGVGDTVNYVVTYKNIGKSTLTHPMIQVIVPSGITITNASRGTYSNETHTLSVPLSDLSRGANDVLYVEGRVDTIPSSTAQIVSTAVLVYTNPSGTQENAIAYVLNKPKDTGNVLGASAFGSGILPTSLIGWLLVIICVMAIIIIFSRLAGRNNSGSHTATH